MIEVFLDTLRIKAEEWEKVYNSIVMLFQSYPVKLLRLEAYDGYSANTDSLHTNLFENNGTKEEAISITTDNKTFFSDGTITIYKNWGLQCKEKLDTPTNLDESKPVFWQPINYKAFTQTTKEANAARMFYGDDFQSTAIYRYAVVALGICLENFFPGRAFMAIRNYETDKILKTKLWAESVLNQKLDMPLYLNKANILYYIKEHYPTKSEWVGRIQNLYPKDIYECMVFSLEHIGYEPTLDFYSKYLSSTGFLTFGFSDILQPWIAATRDLEKTLQLIEKSRQFLLDSTNEADQKQADSYDYKKVLKSLLNEYILWSPQQREKLEMLHTNTHFIKGEEEDLFDAMMRVSGLRIDICPAFATKDELFETFLFFDSKHASEYKKIIDEWIEKNGGEYEELYNSLEQFEQRQSNNAITNERDANKSNKTQQTYLSNAEKEVIMEMHPKEAGFIFSEIMERFPMVFNIDETIKKMIKIINSLLKKDKRKKDIMDFCKMDKDSKIDVIRRVLKTKRFNYSAGPSFLDLLKVTDENIILYIFLILLLKITDEELYIARQHLIIDNAKWHLIKKYGLTEKDLS